MSMARLETTDRPPCDPVRVAIIVPTYKQPGLLTEALDTALRQRCDLDLVSFPGVGCVEVT